VFLGDIKKAFEKNPNLTNLLLDPFFKKAIKSCTRSWRKVVSAAVKKGIPVPAFSSALAFFDGIRSERLPANLLQAQRELIRSPPGRSPLRLFASGETPFAATLAAQVFGADTCERVDKPRGEFFHTNWTGTGGRVASRVTPSEPGTLASSDREGCEAPGLFVSTPAVRSHLRLCRLRRTDPNQNPRLADVCFHGNEPCSWRAWQFRMAL